MFTTSPIAVTSPPSAPTSTSPVLTPTRICEARRRRGRRGSRACAASGARSARRARRRPRARPGAPKIATISSPTILSTRPPYAVTSAARAPKHVSTSRLTCSGSAVWESVVNPTRSAKTRVATRRSSGRVTSACPHVGQKRASGGALAPHAGQFTSGQPTGRGRPCVPFARCVRSSAGDGGASGRRQWRRWSRRSPTPRSSRRCSASRGGNARATRS